MIFACYLRLTGWKDTAAEELFPTGAISSRPGDAYLDPAGGIAMTERQAARASMQEDAFRILVVDDNRDAGETLAQLLGAIGFETRYTTDGATAMQCAREFLPHLALLDIGLPDTDGYALAKELRALAGVERLHLVALTGYGDEADVACAREAGFERHLAKPVGVNELVGVISALLGSRSS